MWASRRVRLGLGGFEPLASMLTLLALRRGLSRAARWALPVSVLGAVGALCLARWAPAVPRGVMALPWVCLVWPLASAWHGVWARPLPALAEVDARLGADAAVLTAAELALAPRASADGAMAARVRDDARRALAGRGAWHAVAPLSRRRMAAALVTVLGFAGAMVVPVPPARGRGATRAVARPDAAAAEMARTAAETLRTAALHDAPGEAPLAPVAARAEALTRALEAGMSRDEALAATDALDRSLEDALAWTRAAEHQRAVDAALAALHDPSLDAVRDALAQGDLAAVDAAVRRIADRREAASQQAAAEALERAAEAARAAGSAALGSALAEEAGLLRRRSTATALAQALAQALGETEAGRRVAEHLAREGAEEGAVSRALDAAMREFDRGLTPAERQRVARALAQLASQPEATSRAELDRAARAMSPEEARAAMRALMASLRRGGLDRSRLAQRGRAGAAGRAALQGLRVRLQTGGGAPGSGGRGSGHDPGHVATTGSTARVRGDGFVAPVDPTRDPSRPGLPVESVRVQTTGARATTPDAVRLREAAPAALRGVEQMPVPAPWRDQVRGYFGPGG